MRFDALSVLPAPEQHAAYLGRLVDHLEEARRTSPAEVLAEFLGAPADPATLGVVGIHHVAAYAGDYEHEDDFDAWLKSVQACDGVSDVRNGPSYIAPREYGAPGHWINLAVGEHEYELFSCRRHGEWAGFTPDRKVTLMSHYGLAVDRPEQVPALLAFLAARPGIEQVVYTPADELGHCYGHLRNAGTDGVLEIVYSPDESPDESPQEQELTDG
jgi:hypothetical protein